MPELVILDVGHGNCAIVVDSAGVTVVDAPRTELLVEFLRVRGIREIEAALISHADADHIGGMAALLVRPDIAVRHIFVNPDARGTNAWMMFRHAFGSRRSARGARQRAHDPFAG